MTHYSENSDMVKAHFFKPSGKWYSTEALNMADCYYEASSADAVKKALRITRPTIGNSFTVVVDEPSHMNPLPVLLVAGTYNKDDSA